MTSTFFCFLAIAAASSIPVAACAEITVGVNQRTVVHKDSNGIATAFPDVCKTPPDSGPIPIPYPNIAMSDDTSKSAKSTKAGPAASYTLGARGEGKLTILQTAGTRSVTKATYTDGKGMRLLLREPALVELANGELCGVCATKDGKVTAVYRLLPAAKLAKPKIRLRNEVVTE